jgi:hypothetical protein
MRPDRIKSVASVCKHNPTVFPHRHWYFSTLKAYRPNIIGRGRLISCLVRFADLGMKPNGLLDHKLHLCLGLSNALNTKGGMEVKLHILLTSALDESVVSLMLRPFYSRKVLKITI